MATAQPISFDNSFDGLNDYTMAGSYNGQNGSFNPSSYTRRAIGSPLDFRSGSFGSRFYPGVSPGQLLGPLDPNDFKFGKMSSSIESDRGSVLNAFGVFDRQHDLCRDYTCCGLHLTDLHALVDHFEECHVVVVDPYAPQTSAQTLIPNSIAPSFPQVQDQPASYGHGAFDPSDDMDLDVEHASAPSSGASSPPDTPITTPLTSYTHHAYGSNPASASPSPRPPPVSAFDTTTVMPSRAVHPGLSNFRGSVTGPSAPQDAFNSYAYSDYSTLLPNAGQSSVGLRSQSQDPGCAPTALILNSSGSNTPNSTPASSRVASPSPTTGTAFRSVASASSSSAAGPSSAAGSSSAQSTPRASTTLSRPASSLLLSKPFRCPKPNCNKSYKQANGLKYHMTHGSCNFAPPKDLEHLQELLASKKAAKEKESGGTGESSLSDAEMREVEKEAERRLRPYACGVGDCQRRYKNMNGLRYHYQHSGDHGAIGLALLASGQHECLQHNKSHSRHATATATPSTNMAQQQQQNFSAPPAYGQHPPAYAQQQPMQFAGYMQHQS